MRVLGFRLIPLALVIVATGPTFAQNRPAPAEGPPAVYFLSVGSGTYRDPYLGNLAASETSARLVAASLLAAGAKYGILLASQSATQSAPVTRSDIRAAIERLKVKIREDRPVAPRIVVYMMGHGYGDPAVQSMFFVPGDLVIEPGQLRQTDTTNLVQRSIWNLDMIGALVNFRSDSSMAHFDIFWASDMMVDISDPIKSMARIWATISRMDAADRANREAGRYLSGGNPPVPYILLFDNCFSDVEQDLVIDASPVTAFLESGLEELTEDGLVLYAASPGRAALTVPVPKMLPPDLAKVPIGSGDMGPLGRRLIEVLTSASGADAPTLAEFKSMLTEPTTYTGTSPMTPFTHRGELSADVAKVTVINADHRQEGKLEMASGTGG